MKFHFDVSPTILTFQSDGRKYLKKRLTRHDVKCLSDVVGFTIGLRDAPEEEIPPVHLPTLDGLIKGWLSSKYGHTRGHEKLRFSLYN